MDLIYYELKSQSDVFIMSKGHGALAQYVVLESRGVLPSIALDKYCTPEGRLGAHPDRGIAGIEASTGSLGHGLGLAVGVAYAERLKGSDVRVFCLISDGELQSGSTWEAVQMASNLMLGNLVCFVDLNDYGGLEKISEAHPSVYPVADKFDAFGWEAMDARGHDVEHMKEAVFKRRGNLPFALVCHTVKGCGVSYMVDQPIWHYRSPNPAEYATAMLELE